MRNRIALGVLTGTAVLAGAGVAVAQGDLFGASEQPVPLAADAPIAPPAGRGNLGAEHQTSSEAFRAHIERSGGDYVAGADWTTAESFVVPGTKLRGWTFSLPDKRCLALPDPLADGYGLTCKTESEIEEGRATVALLPPAALGEPNVVGALVSEGQTAQLTSAQDGVRWARVGGAYVGSGPAGSRLVTASGSQTLSPPTESVSRAAPTR